jgi:hypothetical protein
MKLLIFGIIASLAAACSSPTQQVSTPGTMSSPTVKPVDGSTTATTRNDAKANTHERPTESMEMKCKLATDERTLIIVPKELGCELHYQKFGKNEIKASSTSGQMHCEKVRSRMKKNLESAGFKCQ